MQERASENIPLGVLVEIPMKNKQAAYIESQFDMQRSDEYFG